MRVTIKYKARMSWDIYVDVMCNIVHTIDFQPDGTWVTVDLKWEPVG